MGREPSGPPAPGCPRARRCRAAVAMRPAVPIRLELGCGAGASGTMNRPEPRDGYARRLACLVPSVAPVVADPDSCPGLPSSSKQLTRMRKSYRRPPLRAREKSENSLGRLLFRVASQRLRECPCCHLSGTLRAAGLKLPQQTRHVEPRLKAALTQGLLGLLWLVGGCPRCRIRRNAQAVHSSQTASRI